MTRDQIARRAATEIAATLGVEIANRASYSYRATGAAAAWRIVNNRYGARIAVNVEDVDEPIGVIETGSIDYPVHHLSLRHYGGLGWIESTMAGPTLINPLGASHPVLH